MGTHKPCVALTGATGFVGRHVLRTLAAEGVSVRALVRDPSKLGVHDAHVTPVRGDLFDDNALTELVRGVDAVVHLVGIIMEKPAQGQTFARIHVEATQRLLAAAKGAGVKRWVHMSALGSRPGAASRYHQTKWTAEQALRSSGLSWTIFRPSIIHGPDGEFMQLVKGFWTSVFPPFVPYFGAGLFGCRGAGKLQPVWVEDVAACFTAAVTLDKAIGETYPLGGPNSYTWPQLYDTVRQYLPKARRKKIVAVPAWYAKKIAGLPGVPFNRDQVVMSQEDSVCEIHKAQGDFGIQLRPFEDALKDYAREL